LFAWVIPASLLFSIFWPHIHHTHT
jgi:hypothetical protein